MIMRQMEIALLAILALATPVQAEVARYTGPYEARAVKALDADTIRARVKIWPTVEVLATVRLAGIDTPEKGGRARCPEEAAAAARATRYVRNLLRRNRKLLLRDVRLGKYAGRIVARVYVVRRSGRVVDLAALLLRRGLGRAYDGGHRKGWCPPPRSSGKEDRLR